MVNFLRADFLLSNVWVQCLSIIRISWGALKKKQNTEARDSKQTILIQISEYDASALPFCKVQSSLGIAVLAECKIKLGG